MKCWDKPGHTCELVPGTQCSVSCMKTFTAPTTLQSVVTTNYENDDNTTSDGTIGNKKGTTGCVNAKCFLLKS